MEKSNTNVIFVEKLGDSFLVWNLEDVKILRCKFRIIGNAIGCLPLAVYQNEQLGLPLKLMNEEVYLLVESGIAKIYCQKCIEETQHVEKAKQFFEAYVENQRIQQSILCHKDKVSEQLSKVREILKGRKIKQLKRRTNPNNASATVLRVTETDLSTVVVEIDDQEIEKLEGEIRNQPMTMLDSDHVLKEIFATSPIKSLEDYECVEIELPKSGRNRLKYISFKRLHDQGNYLTSGFKFGGDFLVYPGDPLKYHASHVVLIFDENETVTNLDKFAWCRLGSQVKKIYILCTWNSAKTDALFEYIHWQKTKNIKEK